MGIEYGSPFCIWYLSCPGAELSPAKAQLAPRKKPELPPPPPAVKSRPMREEFRTVLRRHHMILQRDLDLTILPELVQEGVFSVETCERIKAEKARPEQISVLLNTLERRGDDAFPKFLQALKTEFNFLYDIIKENFDEEYNFYVPTAKIRGTVKELTYDDSYEDWDHGYIVAPFDQDKPEQKKPFVEINDTMVVKADVEAVVVEDETNCIEGESQETKKVHLKRGEIVIRSLAVSEENAMIRVIDVQGCCLSVPKTYLQLYGDPKGEMWYFPKEISSRQATLLLKDLRYEGAYMVYKSSSRSVGVVFNLSVCRASGDVIHYPIFQNDRKEVYINAEKVFMCIQDLVKHYHKSRGGICCRLKRCPRELGQPIASQIPNQYKLDLSELVYVTAPDSESYKFIGKGNYSRVALAEYRGSRVAVKIPTSGVEELNAGDMLEEVQTMIDLDHQNILKFIGMSTEGQTLLATEYMPGGDLLHWLRMRPALDLVRAVRMGCQILSALAYLHNLKYVIHRDIAARNCLVAEREILKLSDFGKARQVDDNEYKGEEGERVPIRWAAVETLTEQKYSTRSDVWSAGVLFYELLSSGGMPYKGMSNHYVVQHVVRGGKLDCPRGCPPHVFDVINKCWAENPKERPPAVQLREIFKNSVYGVQLQAVRPARKSESDTDPYASL